MTEQEAFEAWLSKLPREKVTSWRDVWRDACAWKQEQIERLEKELAEVKK